MFILGRETVLHRDEGQLHRNDLRKPSPGVLGNSGIRLQPHRDVTRGQQGLRPT